jgi:hypothetical protein
MPNDPTPRFVTVGIADPYTKSCYTVSVPASSTQEALDFLNHVGGGLGGSGMRQMLAGATLGPIREAYYRQLAGVEREIATRRAALGSAPSDSALRELAEWAVRQRAQAARVWRIPSGPAAVVVGEARDWSQYGFGGRTVGNIERRAATRGLSGVEMSEYFLRGATKPNVEVTAQLMRGAQFLRRGGGILALAGVIVTEEEIRRAPAAQRAEIVEHEAAGFVGGFVAGEGAVGTVLAVSAAFALATPPGWILLGIGVVAGVVGSYAADRLLFHDRGADAVETIRRGQPIDAAALMPVCPQR